MDTPQVDKDTANALVQRMIDRAASLSGGQLRAFQVGSPIRMFFESIAIAAVEVSEELNKKTNDLENQILSYFGLVRRTGTAATGTVTIELDGLYPDSFLLPASFKLNSAGIEFETAGDVVIPAYNLTSSTLVRATSVGANTNLPSSSGITFTNINRVASIVWVDDTAGGLDAETEEEWQQRIVSTLRRRDTLISLIDFEEEVRSILGTGSNAIAVGRLSPQDTYDNGYVTVFGINADGTLLTTSQISDLSERISPKAPMATVTVKTMENQEIKVSSILEITSNGDVDTTLSTVETAIKNYLSPKELKQLILPKALEYNIQQLPNVMPGTVTVEFDDLAQPKNLPNSWTVAIAGTVEVTVIKDKIEYTN